MKLRNKVLLAALTITMTTGPSLTKHFSAFNLKINVAYASEEGSSVEDTNAEIKEVTNLKKVSFTEEELKVLVNNSSNYLIANYEGLLAYEKLEDKTFYEENLKLLKREPTIEKTDTDEKNL